MRGRANNPVVQKAKARAHAKREHYCSCGKVVWGNGGKSSHAAMHARRHDGFHRITPEVWRARFDTKESP